MSDPCTHICDTIDGLCPWCRIAELEAEVSAKDKRINDLKCELADSIDNEMDAEQYKRERDEAREEAAMWERCARYWWANRPPRLEPLKVKSGAALGKEAGDE